MLRSFAGVTALSLLVATVACGSSGGSSSGNSETPDSGTPDTGSTIDGGGADAGNAVQLPFKPSNISFDGIDVSKLGDFVVDRPNCEIRSEEKIVGCGDQDKLGFTIVTQPGAGKIGVYVARNVRIEPNTSLKVNGTFAIAIVALESFEILGGIDAGASTDTRSPGGFTHGTKEQQAGGGPGGGGAGSDKSGGGGGSFCGIGGKGGALAGGTPAEGGKPYGTPTLIPLMGGSAGGSAALPNSGSGGGAIQLVAGKVFTLSAGAYVTVGGGGGAFAGGPSTQHAAGGGSGGAILIEAPKTVLTGTLAANGGGGGAAQFGKDGTPDEVPAAGGSALPAGSVGGAGSANANANGVDATRIDTDNGPGGGGGAGRIRVNNDEEKNIPLTGVLSPSANLPCATGGPLTK